MSKTMTFLELQKKIVQTRKARKGIKHSIDYYGDDFKTEDFEDAVYHRTLGHANEIVKRLLNNGNKPIKIYFKEPKKECIYHKDYKTLYEKKFREVEKYEREWKKTMEQNSELINENLKLMQEVSQLKEELGRTKRGGRKEDKEKEGVIVTYKVNSPDATVREIANALKVSKTTVQKVLVKHNLNGRKK